MPFPCPDCCDDDEPCEGTDCNHCANTSPTCWRVVISGVVAADPESCEDCPTLNRVYYLHQDPLEPCRWICNDVADVDCDDSDSISLTVYRDGNGNYKIRVELGDHRWIGEYGATPISCCSIVNDELTHDRSGSDCDSSGATCTITRQTGSDPCPCVQPCTSLLPNLPACFKIEWTGLSNRSPLGELDCRFCECYTTTPQRIPWESGAGKTCKWVRRHSVGSPRFCDGGWEISIRQLPDETYRLEVKRLGLGAPASYQKDYAVAPDVSTWDQEEIPATGLGRLECDYAAGASVLLTPDYTSACEDRAWGCGSCLCQQTGGSRPDIGVTLEGVEGPFGCCRELNGTFVLQPVGSRICFWEYTADCAGLSEPARITFQFGSVGFGDEISAVLGVEGAGHDVLLFFHIETDGWLDCNEFDITFTSKLPGPQSCGHRNMTAPRAFTL